MPATAIPTVHLAQTASPTDTPTPAATPTATPTLTPSPSPTVVPTPTPTPQRAITIVLNAQEGVPQSLVDAVERGISDFESYAGIMGLPALDVPLHVELYYDAQTWLRQFYREQGYSGGELEQLVQDNAELFSRIGGLAFTGVGGFFGFAVNSASWATGSSVRNIAIHELTHVYQNRLASQAYPNAPRRHSTYIDWLTEGMAELMVELVAPYTDWREYPGACEVPLHDVLELGEEYTTGLLASRLLASKVGARGLFDLYMKIFPNEGIHTAMARVLGIDYDGFSDDFERYCSNGYPLLNIDPIVDYPASRLPLEPWEPSCSVVYPDDIESPESSSIIVALSNICDFVVAFDLAIYDSSAIVDDDPVGLARLIEAHENHRYDLSGYRLGLAVSGTGFATFLTTDLNDVRPNWLTRFVGTNFARLMFNNGTPNLFTEGLGEVIPGLSEAYATRESYEHSDASRSSALKSDASLHALEWDILPWIETHLSVAREVVELLLATYGLETTARYFALDEEIDWRVRFESAYGVTPDEFYELYDQHREAGLPDLSIDLTPFDDESE